MKRWFFLSLMIACATTVLAQRPRFKPQTHQLSLQLGTMHHLLPGGDAPLTNDRSFSLNPVNGLRYTYHYSISHGFRAGVQRLTAQFNTEGLPAMQGATFADVYGWEYNLGYEYKYHFGQSQIFWAIDLLYARQKVWLVGPAIETIPSDAFNGFGGRTGIGYRFFFTPNLSFSLEGYGRFIQRNDDLIAQEASSPFFPSAETSYQVQATLSLHLVKMKKRCECPKLGKSKYR